jgi:hypothetical protein
MDEVLDTEQVEASPKKPNWLKRIIIFVVVLAVVFSVSFSLFQPEYQKELDTVQEGNLTEVRIMAMNNTASDSGAPVYELVISERFDSTFRVSTSQNTYQQLSMGDQTALYFNESLRYVLLEGEMTKFGIELWVVFLLLNSMAIVAILFAVAYVYRRFKKRGRPERPLSELSR